MNGLDSYIAARRAAGTYDDGPPTERVNPIPLDDDDECEVTIVNDGGTVPERDDPCAITVAGWESC